MKKLLLLFLLPLFSLSQITPTNPWLRRGNSSISRDWLGSKDSSQVIFKANNEQVMKLKSVNGENTFTLYENSVFPQSKVVIGPYGTSGFSLSAIYMGVASPDDDNYFAWGNGTTNFVNGPTSLTFGSANKPAMSINTTGTTTTQQILFASINQSVVAAGANVKHFNIQGNKIGFKDGTSAAQQKIIISADTYSAAETSATITTAVTLDVTKATVGTGMTIVNNLAAKFTGNTNTNGLASFGASILTPSASVHIGGQTTTNPAMYFATGSLLTTTVNGAVEWNVGQLYATNSVGRFKVAYVLTNSATLNFPNTVAGAIADLTLTVTGAALNDPVDVGAPNGSITATGSFYGWVSAADVVTIRFLHSSLVNAEDPASGTFKVDVHKN